jgi:hypothetical protein
MEFDVSNFPLRPAWTEIDLGKLRRNLQIIRRDLPRAVKLLAVVKDEAYGHGALDVARIALEEGAWGFGLSTLEEAMALREGGITAPLLLLGERQEAELPWCVEHDLTVCVNEPHTIRKLARVAAAMDKRVPVHLKIHTGMSRWGALGRGPGGHRADPRRKIPAARGRDDPFRPVGRDQQDLCQPPVRAVHRCLARVGTQKHRRDAALL